MVLESHLAMLLSKNRLATTRTCMKQSESSNNWSHVARPYLLSVGAYTASDNLILDEVESALGLLLRHLQRNVLLVLIIN